MTGRVLLVDDDREVREALGQTLELAGYDPLLAGSFVEAKDHLDARFEGVIVTDIRMPGRDGFHLLEFTRQADPDLPVILLTGQADIPMAVRAMGAGAHAFLEKPCAPTDLTAVIAEAMVVRREVLSNRRQKLEAESGDAAARMIFGISKQVADLRDRVRTVANARADVLVIGDPGSGTSKIAEVIHLLSTAAPHPFIKRAAATLTSAELYESVELAGAGSIYLDEVAALSGASQYALLDRLEQSIDSRVIAGTTKDLGQEVAEGRFNPELYYRLELMQVRIPAIRERTEDIPVLFRHYVEQSCEQANLPMPRIAPEVVAGLMEQDWPGNARALMNAAMRFAMGLGDPIEVQGLGLTEQLAQIEKSLLADALHRAKGNATETAKALKLPRKTFYDKLGRHGLRPEDYRRE